MKSDQLTKKVIARMLKENTGRSILDSGDLYGRHYERNQLRDFETEKPAVFSIDFDCLSYTKNIYHFLVETLEYNRIMTDKFYRFENKNSEEFRYLGWQDILQKFYKKHGFHVIHSDYTYNHDNCLSQDIIYTLITSEETHSDFYDTEFLILQIHNGCDARGGFTQPKFFETDIDEFILGFYDCFVSCKNGHGWYSDDSGNNWYSDDSEIRLNKLDLLDLEEYKETEEYHQLEINHQIIPANQISLNGLNPNYNINPVVYPVGCLVYEDEIPYCPICSTTGILEPLIAY